MASIAIMFGGAVLTPLLLSAAIILRGHLAEVTKLHLKKKCAMIKLSRTNKRLTPNTRVTAPNFSTGLRLTRK